MVALIKNEIINFQLKFSFIVFNIPFIWIGISFSIFTNIRFGIFSDDPQPWSIESFLSGRREEL